MGGQSLQINFYWNTAHIYFSVLFVVVGFIGLLTQRLSALAKREMFPTWAFMEKVCYHYAGFNNRFLCRGRSLGLSAWKRIHAHIVRLDSDDICASCSSWHKCLHGAVR